MEKSALSIKLILIFGTMKNRLFPPILYLLLFLIFGIGLQAQSERYDNLAISWQQGLAGGGRALNHSAASVWTNPSVSLNKGFHSESHISFLPVAISVSNLSLLYRPVKKLSMALAVNSENAGQFDRRDTQGNLLGNFTAGHTQYLLNGGLHLSSRLSLAYNYRLSTMAIDGSHYTESANHFSVSISDKADKTHFTLSNLKWSDEIESTIHIALSRHLEYLPLILSLDHQFKSKFDIYTTCISAHILPNEDLDFYAGVTFQRFLMQTHSLAQDFLSGLAAGASWRVKDVNLYLSFYHYGGLGIMSSMGLSWNLTQKERS